MKKATDQQLIESYSRLKNVWKVAKEFSMCGQTVHERLKKLSVIQNNFYTEKEKEEIEKLYKSNFCSGDGKFDELCKELKRDKSAICIFAKRKGWTTTHREKSPGLCKTISTNKKKWHLTHNHPRDMLGKTHLPKHRLTLKKNMEKFHQTATPQEKLRRIKKAFKTKLKKYGSIAPINPYVTWKQGWREIGDKKIYFRSRWEANYGRYLEFLRLRDEIEKWEHEPQTFWFEKIRKGSVTYLPDFKVTKKDGQHYWVEVKGWMDQRSLTKIKRFRKYFPNELLVIIDSKWFRINSQNLSILIPGWEK